jgi:UDP-N-acetylglucosamine 2-epimerase (non-hydrolysing)/GDP/UDP-N,N'-diacetylbacillosamine 2-epimerase (hydrolysing)
MHSVATQFGEAAAQLAPCLEAMAKAAAEGAQVVLTYPNNDAGGRAIMSALEAFAARKLPNIQLHRSLGRHDYHGILNLCGRGGAGGACVGNSSSGIKEAPALGAPTINIGSRQNGRLAADNVINTGYDSEEILAAVHRCLHDTRFIERCHTCVNPYGAGGAGVKIANVLAEVELGPPLITKKMVLP